MKVRPVLFFTIFTLIAIVISSILLFTPEERKNSFYTEGNLINNPIQTSKFISPTADISAHLNIDLNNLSNSNQDNKKHSLNSISNRFRDGLMSTIGIDYESDLSSWINKEISFGMFNLDRSKGIEWIISIEIDDINSLSEISEGFWERRGIDEQDINTETYQEQMISFLDEKLQKKNTLPVAIATSKEGFFLISSNLKVLEDAIQYSQSNQFESEWMNEAIENLNKGMILLRASPKALNLFSVLPSEIIENSGIESIISSIKPIQNGIYLDSLFTSNSEIASEKYNENDPLDLLIQKSGPGKDLIAINNSSELFSNSNKDLLNELSYLLISHIGIGNDSIGINTLMKSTKGPIVLLNTNRGWIAGTKDDEAEFNAIDSKLTIEGYKKSFITNDEDEIITWSKLKTSGRGLNRELFNEIILILTKEGENNWWSNGLSSLNERKDEIAHESQINSIKTERNDQHSRPINKVVLGNDSAKKQLMNWDSWKIIQALIGENLESIITGLNISIGIDDTNDKNTLNINAKLLTS